MYKRQFQNSLLNRTVKLLHPCFQHIFRFVPAFQQKNRVDFVCGLSSGNRNIPVSYTHLAVIVGSVVFYRPFCKWLCPLGAFYALLSKVSLIQMRVDTHKCVSCGACANACKMDVDITKTPNHAECIRCGKCMKACPTDAIQYKFGLGDQSNTETTKE